MRSGVYRAFSLAVGVALWLAAAPAARATTSADLKDEYVGPGFGTRNAANDNQFTIAVLSRQAKGKFTGAAGVVPFTGKVTTKGVVTFTAKFNGFFGPDAAKVTVSFKARLSASNEQLVGTLGVKGTVGGVPQNEVYLVHLTDTSLQDLRRAPVRE